MITIQKSQPNQILVSLNRERVADLQISLVLNSPSRGQLTFDKTLTDEGSGFFSFSLTANESFQLIDDTYRYAIVNDIETLKVGFVRLIEIETELRNDRLDYSLDFLVA